ncbi:MAG: hypothetical protein OEW48_11315 [Phycisphaerae bacterium]|nr:hypothetical protein [Phycisphaerae bacterium]
MRRAKLLLPAVAVSFMLIAGLLLVFFYKRPNTVAEETAFGEKVSVVEENPVQKDVIEPIYGGDGNTPPPTPISPQRYQSIEELSDNMLQRIEELHAARERVFTPLDGKVDDFSVTELTVPEAVAQLSSDYNVLCGIEVIPWPTIQGISMTWPTQRISLSLQKVTPRQILDRLVSLDPTFTWFEDEGIANVVMRQSYETPDYPLSKRIAHFHVNDRPYSNVFLGPTPALFLLSEVRGSLAISITGRWPKELEPHVSVDAVDTTVRQIINKVAREVGMSWSVVSRGMFHGKHVAGFRMHPRMPEPGYYDDRR